MCLARSLRKGKVSSRETIGNFVLMLRRAKQEHAYSSPSKASGKAARARATSIRRSAW